MVVCRDVSAMLPTLNQSNKHSGFFLFAQECNDLKRHLGMDWTQKWQRNVRVRKYPDKRLDYLIAHRTTLSNRTFATKRTKFNFVCTSWLSIHYIYKRFESNWCNDRGVRVQSLSTEKDSYLAIIFIVFNHILIGDSKCKSVFGIFLARIKFSAGMNGPKKLLILNLSPNNFQLNNIKMISNS